MVLQAMCDASDLLFRVGEATAEPMSAQFEETLQLTAGLPDRECLIKAETATAAVAMLRYFIRQKCLIVGLEFEKSLSSTKVPTPKTVSSPHLSSDDEWCRKVLLAPGKRVFQGSFNQANRGKKDSLNKDRVLEIFTKLAGMGLGKEDKCRQGTSGRFSRYFHKTDIDTLSAEDSLNFIENLEKFNISVEVYKQKMAIAEARPLQTSCATTTTTTTRVNAAMATSSSTVISTPRSSLIHNTVTSTPIKQKRPQTVLSPYKSIKPTSPKRSLFTKDRKRPVYNARPKISLINLEEEDIFDFK